MQFGQASVTTDPKCMEQVANSSRKFLKAKGLCGTALTLWVRHHAWAFSPATCTSQILSPSALVAGTLLPFHSSVLSPMQVAPVLACTDFFFHHSLKNRVNQIFM